MADYMQNTEWLLKEILVKVPGEDLVNSELVCKDWRDLIKSPDFLSAHYNHHNLCQEDEPIPGLLKKDNKRKSNCYDEYLDDYDITDSSEEDSSEEEEEEDEPAQAAKTAKKAHKKTASETVEKKQKRFEAVEEKLCQQRLVGEDDCKSTAELFGKMGAEKTLDNFIPKSESDFIEYAELVANKLRTYEKSYHYIGLLKAVMRLSMGSLQGSNATYILMSITAYANEKIKVEKEANAGKKKTEDEPVLSLLKNDYVQYSNSWVVEDLDDNAVKDSWEEEDEPAPAPKTEPMPTEKASAEGSPSALVSSSQKESFFASIQSPVLNNHHILCQEDNNRQSTWDDRDLDDNEKKKKRFEALKEAPLDPVEEKLRQQRLVGEADYKSTAELFGKMGDKKTLDDFIPKSESDFTEYAELVANKLRTYENSYHYIDLVESVIRLSMVSLKGSDAKDILLSINEIANERIKVEQDSFEQFRLSRWDVEAGLYANVVKD